MILLSSVQVPLLLLLRGIYLLNFRVLWIDGLEDYKLLAGPWPHSNPSVTYWTSNGQDHHGSMLQ